MERILVGEGGIEWFVGEEPDPSQWEPFSPAGFRCLAAWAMRRAQDLVDELIQSERQLVYFARAGGKVKIGTSRDVPARLRSLQTGCPHPIELLHVEVGDEAREQVWHDRFKHLRAQGEWFHLSGLLAEMLGFDPNAAFVDDKAASAAEERADLAEQRAEVEERAAQARLRAREAISRTNRARTAERRLVEQSVLRILEAWDRAGSWIPADAEQTVERWLDRISEDEMLLHIDRVHSVGRSSYWRYFCGVMWNIYKDREA